MLLSVLFDVMVNVLVKVMDKMPLLINVDKLFETIGVTQLYNEIIGFTTLSPSVLINSIIF